MHMLWQSLSAKSIWDLHGNDQKRIVDVKDGEQERGWNPKNDHAPMEKRCERLSAGVCIIRLAHIRERNDCWEWWHFLASSVMTTSVSGLQEIKIAISEKSCETLCPGTCFI